jgi:hypothetical protein
VRNKKGEKKMKKMLQITAVSLVAAIFFAGCCGDGSKHHCKKHHNKDQRCCIEEKASCESAEKKDCIKKSADECPVKKECKKISE